MRLKSYWMAIWPAIVFILIAAAGATPVFAAATTVTDISNSGTTVPRYGKFEATFHISRSFAADSFLPYYYYDTTDASPYGADGITINAIVKTPSGKTLTVPAFYYQQYSMSQNSQGNEVMTPTSTYSWKIRFAPVETGTYTYTLSIADKNGTSVYPPSGSPLSFTAVASDNPGFLRVSPRDPRFFEFSNGTSFIPIASGHQWWSGDSRAYDYISTFKQFAQNGINFTRIWTQNDGYGLTLEGHFDHYQYPDDFNPTDRGIDIAALPKGTQINQRGASELDAIVNAAEQNGIYMEVSAHGDPYWIWDASVYDESWNPNPVSFADPKHINYWKRNYRYRIARWGYSTAVATWETWNEHGNIEPGSDVDNFYKTLTPYIHQTDPFGHLVTTSQGSQTWSPAFLSSSASDVSNYHDYLMVCRYGEFALDAANFVNNMAQCMRTTNPYTTNGCHIGQSTTLSWSGSQKPIVWGELDTGTITAYNEGACQWNAPNPNERADHNMLWAGLFSPLGGTGVDWYWQSKTYLTQKYHDASVASAFFKGIDYAGERFAYLATADTRVTSGLISATNATIRVLAMRNAANTKAYAWVQNKNFTWQNSGTPTAVSGSFTVPGMSAGTYRITYMNTTTGVTADGGTTTAVSGVVTIPVSGLSQDLAVKILSTSPGASPSATPTPMMLTTPTAAPTPAPTGIPTGNGDVNQDGQVTAADVITLLQNWFAPSSTSQDQYPDGTVNAMDFAVVRQKMLSIGSTTVMPTLAKAPSPTSPPKTPTPAPSRAATPTPTPAANPTASPTPYPTLPPPSASEWTQFAHDAQHTSATVQTVPTPWKFAWSWNASDNQGKTQPFVHLPVADMMQPVTGGGYVYMSANNKIFALNQQNGSQIWVKDALGSIVASPAYGNSSLFVGGGSTIYKLNAASGTIAGSFITAGPIITAPSLVASTLYVIGGNTLYAINTTTMKPNWSYQAAAIGVSPPAYSAKYNTVIFNSQDLIVHAVNATSGALKWKTNPWNLATPPRHYEPGDYYDSSGAQFDRGWPVIAEQHGIVLVRLELDWGTLFGDETNGAFPSTTAEVQNYLTQNRTLQSVFALNLSDGTTAFIPAVGAGAHTDNGTRMGPQPVVTNMNGQEVAYVFWRSKQSCSYNPVSPDFLGTVVWCGGMWDSAMGEMVLDDSSVTGYKAGQLRFVNYQLSANQTAPSFPSDELGELSMSGSTLFHSHWLISFGKTITDRNNSLGNTFTNPIKTTQTSAVIWAEGSPNTYNVSCDFSSSHYCANGLVSYGGGNTDFVRAYPPGFYEYYNDWCTLSNSCGNLNNTGQEQPYTIVSNNLVLVKSTEGGLMAFTSGSPLAATGTYSVLGASTTETPAEITPLSDVHGKLNQQVTVEGEITDATDRLPKAYYFKLKDDSGTLQLRIFAFDMQKFTTPPKSLIGKKVRVTGIVSLYGPQGVDPEIVLTDPSQLTVQKQSIIQTFRTFISRFPIHL